MSTYGSGILVIQMDWKDRTSAGTGYRD